MQTGSLWGRRFWVAPLALMAAAACVAIPAARGQPPSGDLIEALRSGGYVIVMRNARSAEQPPPEDERSPANFDGEREIDERGQAQMAAMSFAFRELDLPVGQTLTSPAYRSVQSAGYFGFGERVEVAELAAPSDGGNAQWLRARATQAPAEGENTMIVTHGSLIAEGFRDVSDLGPAESLIFRPGAGQPELVARMTYEDWANVAVE